MENLINLLPWGILWLGVLLFFRLHKIWVFYFIWGSIGFTLLVVFGLSGTWVEQVLSQAAISLITRVNDYMGVPVTPFANAGTVLMTGTRISGYTSLEVGTECSGLLEGAVLWGLTIFYPALTLRNKTLTLTVGSVLIYLINILRLEIIIVAIFLGGRDMIFLAHTVIGRGAFFILMIILYWFFFTKSTLRFLHQSK